MEHVPSSPTPGLFEAGLADPGETLVALQEALAARSAQRDAAVQELTRFSHAIAHDLRAPLRHIAGFADLLEAEDGPRLSEKGRRHLATIQRSARIMDGLIDQLIDFSHWGVVDLRLATVDLDSLVPAVIADLPPEAAQRELRWELGPLPRVRADPDLLQRALGNVLANAVRFTRPRPIGRIEIGRHQSPGALGLYIRDNGLGFKPEYAHRLFEPFQRLHADPQLVGAAMGLAQVRRIMARHAGRAWGESDGVSGATFFLTVPA